MMRILFAAAAVLALGACGENAQEMGVAKTEGAAGSAFMGTGMPYVAQGWKAGDRTSWEQQLKTRAQTGQNDYARIN